MVAYRKDRRLTGSYKPSRDPPRLAYARPPAGELAPQQRELLALRPKRLTPAEKLEFRRKVIGAPWLGADDVELLVLWVQTRSRYQTAGQAYDRLLRDPLFPVPGSIVSKAATSLGHLVTREAHSLIGLAQKLGFSPTARLALGVETRKPDPPGDDPWKQLRLVRKTED